MSVDFDVRGQTFSLDEKLLMFLLIMDCSFGLKQKFKVKCLNNAIVPYKHAYF